MFELSKKRLENYPKKINTKNQSIKYESIENSNINNMEKWKDILLEVMGQKSVNEHLKSKIKTFL